MKPASIAIIGRTNVGKSSLFNALAGKHLAIVEDFPGVTRDRKNVTCDFDGYVHELIDTGGLYGDESGDFALSVREQALRALNDADLAIALFDGINGPNPLDGEIVKTIRESQKPVLWVVNKCEKPTSALSAAEFYELGIDDIITISAIHKIGIRELKTTINSLLQSRISKKIEQDPTVKVALLGKPNVGKSTLLNKIIGEERVITSNIPGTTRDSIDVAITRNGVKFTFVDTAGLRKKAKVDDNTIERISNMRSLRALAQCDVAILVLDASSEMAGVQDARLAGLAHDRGRGLIIAVNKWDAIEKDHKTVKQYENFLHEHFKFARYAPLLFISALTGKRCPSVIEEVNKVYEATLKRVSTAEVNKVLIAAVNKKTPTLYRGHPLKFYFATQIGVKPPTFVIFCNHPNKVQFGYKRYLINAFRKEFEFHGVDIKVHFRKRRNELLEKQDNK
jgi:GTPase